MRSSDINPMHVMSEVYSYPFPEVRTLLAGIDLDPAFMLNTLPVERAAGMLATYDLRPALELPATPDGALDLDELHVPVIERMRSVMGSYMPGLEDFAHAYPTHGSSPSIFTLLAEWHARGNLESLAVLDGEYEGYAAYAGALGIPVTRYTSLTGSSPRRGQTWFVSNPSAVDGNWIDQAAWDAFVMAGHDIVLDAAYAGLTRYGAMAVGSPHIKAVLTSPSKSFGVFRYRHTGVTYTRDPVASMYGTRWFKDVPALLDTLKLYEAFGGNELPCRYRPVQEDICRALSVLAGAEILSSDVLLLGTTRERLDEPYQRFARARGYRFGLTKLFEDVERSQN